MDTAASSGSISTQQFGEKFDADKVETGPLVYFISVYTPDSVRNNPNATLHIDVEKVSMTDLSSGEDTLSVDETMVEKSHRSFNFTQPSDIWYHIQFRRKVIQADVRKQRLYRMPGFKLRWHYSGMKVESEAIFYKSANTKAFIRNGFYIKFKYICYNAIFVLNKSETLIDAI